MFFEIKSSDLVGKRVLEVGGLRFFQTFRNHAPASLLLPVQELIELLSSLTAIHPPFDPPRSLSAQSVPRSNFVAKVPNCNMTDRNAEVLGICNQTMVSTLSTSTGKSSADVRVFAARQQEDENALGKFVCLFVRHYALGSVPDHLLSHILSYNLSSFSYNDRFSRARPSSGGGSSFF